MTGGSRLNVTHIMEAQNIVKEERSRIDGKFNWSEVRDLIRKRKKDNGCGRRAIEQICESLNIELTEYVEYTETTKRIMDVESRLDELERLVKTLLQVHGRS